MDMLQKKLVAVERAAASPMNPKIWAAAAMSSSYGSVMPNPFGFYVTGTVTSYSPPFILHHALKKRSSMIRDTDLDDDSDFDVFANYRSKSLLKINLREMPCIEDCWRKSCSHSYFDELLTKKCFSEKERTTINCTVDHCYGKKALSPNRLKVVREVIASVQPPQSGQKRRLHGGRATNMPLI